METRGLTLDVILEKHGALGETQIWALLYHLALYLKNTLKDAESWTSGPLLSICSTNVIINDDDTVAVKKGSVGEFGKGMFVAPEYYNTETNFKAEKAVESAYVYSTGMMLYSAAEHNTTEEVDLPDDLEDILIGMVNEVAVSRINIDTIIRVCEVRKHNLLSALSELVKELLPDDNVQTEELDSQRTCAETPLTQNKDHPPSSLTNDQSTGDNSRSQAEMVEYANMIPDHADVEHGIAGGSSVPPYPTSQTPHSASQTTPLVGGDSDDGYSNADLLNLNYNKTNYEHDSLSKTTSSNSIENPYGTFNRRKKEDGCEPGQCVHTAEDIDAMYSVISKTRTIEKRENRVNRKVSGTGRVHGHKLDTRLHDESSPKQLTMKTPVNGKPVVVQLPSNKKFQVIVEREDTLEVVFKIVTEKLGLDDTSLFGLMYCPPKGLYEFIPLSHKLRHYAPDKWKSGVQMPPPLALRLAVKYFPPQPYKFVNPMTRLQYFLNLRSLILDGTYQVSKETAFDLVALCLQTDIGDYYDIKDSDDYFQPYNYLPPQVMNDVSHHYVTKEIPMLHSKLDDMSQNEAVIRYLQIVGQLPDYGYHFFEVTERNYYEEKHTWLGVGLQSVNIYERSKVSTIVRGPAKVIPWHKITNLSYKSKSFLMDIVYEGDKRGQRRYVFDTDSTKVSRAIMTLCADTHKFYIKIKNMLPPPHEVPDTFSVRDYTPSPRAIIGNHHVDNSGNPNYAQSRASSTGHVTNPPPPQSSPPVPAQSDAPPPYSNLTLQKRPPPSHQMTQKYVCLVKKDHSHSLGLTIVGGDGTQGIYVDKLAPGGLASLDGRIKRGDMITTVNDISLRGMTHKEAVDLITSQPYRVEIELIESTDGVIPYDITAEGADNEGVRSLHTGSGSRTPVSLEPSSTNLESLPQSLQNRLRFQQKLKLSSTNQASSETRFTPEPRRNAESSVISDDSVNRSDGGYGSTDNTSLQSSPTPCVTRDPFSRIFTVYLTKRKGSLGINVRVNNNIVYVKEIFPNSPAAESGMIETGDSILSVNGVKLTNMTHGEVIQVLQTAPDNVTLVMSWGSGYKSLTKEQGVQRVGMQFKVSLTRDDSGFGFSYRRTFMGNESYIRIKSVLENGPAALNGCLEEGDILITAGDVTLIDQSDKSVTEILKTAPIPAVFTVYRPNTIDTFNPNKFEIGMVLPLVQIKTCDIDGFVFCNGYPYFDTAHVQNESNLKPHDRLLRIGNNCCQGIKKPYLDKLTDGMKILDVQLFRPGLREISGRTLAKASHVDISNLTEELMDNARVVVLHKKEQGLGFSLLGQLDGKRLVYGVTIKTILTVGAAYDEGSLRPGDLIIMINGISMIGITQSKALSTIRKCNGEVVLTVVPGHKRDVSQLSGTERRIISSVHNEKTTDM